MTVIRKSDGKTDAVPLDSDLLRTFVAVAESGNFTKAGEAVGRTQSAVSMQMKKLEYVLGEPLFDRGSRGVSFTDAGKRLLDNSPGSLRFWTTRRRPFACRCWMASCASAFPRNI